MTRFVRARPYLYLELILLTIGVPLALSTIIPLRYMLPLLWLIALYCHLVYRALVDAPERIYWRWGQVNRENLRRVLGRFAACTTFTALAVAWMKPDFFLQFVCERPAFWAFVMVAYPLLSVIPQEIMFRSFFFERYARIFPKPVLMIAASGVLFGAAHLIFMNWVAPALCVVGGLFFAQTYQRTRSLALAVIEHALYGCMIFTVGLGPYFYHGAVYSKWERKVAPQCAFIPERIAQVKAAL